MLIEESTFISTDMQASSLTTGGKEVYHYNQLVLFITSYVGAFINQSEATYPKIEEQ